MVDLPGNCLFHPILSISGARIQTQMLDIAKTINHNLSVLSVKKISSISLDFLPCDEIICFFETNSIIKIKFYNIAID